MFIEPLYCQEEGVVTSIQKIGNKYEVWVDSGSRKAKYHSLDVVSVFVLQKLNVGDLIGYQNSNSSVSSNNVNNDCNCGGGTYGLIYEEWIDLPSGNGTNQFQHQLLIGAIDVEFYRESLLKIPNLPNDSYTFDPITGTIQTTEIMETYQRFRIKVKKFIG